MLFCHGVQRCRLPVLREIRQPLGTSVEAPSFLWTGDYYALTNKGRISIKSEEPRSMPLRVSAEALFCLLFYAQCFEYRILCTLIKDEVKAPDQF